MTDVGKAYSMVTRRDRPISLLSSQAEWSRWRWSGSCSSEAKLSWVCRQWKVSCSWSSSTTWKSMELYRRDSGSGCCLTRPEEEVSNTLTFCFSLAWSLEYSHEMLTLFTLSFTAAATEAFSLNQMSPNVSFHRTSLLWCSVKWVKTLNKVWCFPLLLHHCCSTVWTGLTIQAIEEADSLEKHWSLLIKLKKKKKNWYKKQDR